MTKINLPDRLVIMANHQAYTDWMYLWIIACYAGHSRGIIILLKDTLKHIPIVGWGMVRHLSHNVIRLSCHLSICSSPCDAISLGWSLIPRYRYIAAFHNGR